MKKQWYWAKNVDGDKTKLLFEDVPIGVTKTLLGELQGEKIDLFWLREPDFVMILIRTYGSINSNQDQRDTLRYNQKKE